MTNNKKFAALSFAFFAAALVIPCGTQAQQPIGSVSTADASVGGVLETSGSTATIVNNGTITAHDHMAAIKLARGGSVHVCSTSVVHLSQNASKAGGPLLVALDRGALELAFAANSGDAILTPDMKMQPSVPGPLDLRIRVVSNGDTCVENRGSSAPALMISDTFGESSYIVHAGQRVLFEHGSLKQVVDSESSPCGCPPPVISVAEGGVAGAHAAKPGSVVETHPFPEAVSQGLAPAPVPMAPAQAAGEAHLQVDMSLSYNGTKDPVVRQAETAQQAQAGSAAAVNALASAAVGVAEMSPAPATVETKPVVAQAPPPPPPPTDDLAHAFVRFYRWVFHRKS